MTSRLLYTEEVQISLDYVGIRRTFSICMCSDVCLLNSTCIVVLVIISYDLLCLHRRQINLNVESDLLISTRTLQ